MSTASPAGPSGPPRAADPDAALLRRIERTALAFVLLAGAVAGLAGGMVWAGGVLGGGVLAGASYWAIRSSVDALVLAALPTAAPTADEGLSPPPRSVWRGVLVLLGRHALLALAAYVIIARLRLQPIGLLIGASAVAVAAVAESLRGLRR
jgi:hypothetical protein